MTRKSDSDLSYKSAGVDIDAGNRLVERIKPAVRSTRRDEVLGGLGGFGGLFHLGRRFDDPVLVSGTDGVGTKLLLARQLNRHRGIGIDLVAMCVNDILVCGAEPLFFLDYYACGKLDVDAAAEVIKGIAAGCEQAGCALIGGETAEMPGMYAPGDYDLAGFAVGAVERERIVDGTRINDDCVLLGLPSSGAHSNGYSLIRKVLERVGGIARNAERAEALMAPTRIYVREVLPLLDDFDIRGMAHITGGGLDENIVRVLPDEFGLEIDTTAWQPPELFSWLAETGGIDPAEMRRTFNLGIGFVLIVPKAQAGAIADRLADRLAESNGARPVLFGRVRKVEPGRARVGFIEA
ncbi:MAG: phosphoribosylformylglycinamidine cyclo-ligase [Wenzhouxiangellaceae bacterium]